MWLFWFVLGLTFDALAVGVFVTPVAYRYPALLRAGWGAVVIGVWCYFAAVTVS